MPRAQGFYAYPCRTRTTPINCEYRRKANKRKKLCIMFLKNNIDETFIQQFAALGVTNENDIVTILNGFDQIAEIGYAWYVNNKANKLNNND